MNSAYQNQEQLVKQQKINPQILEQHLLSQALNTQEEFLDYFNKDQIYQLTQQEANDPIYGKVDIYQLKPQFQNQLQNQAYPKWLPQQIAVFSQNQASLDFSQKISQHMKHLFQFHPELLRIFGSFEADRPAQHVFLEYENRTLLNEIQERKRQQQRRFDENLLWHILYNLLKGAFSVQDINAGQISDILPYNVIYKNYQVKLLSDAFVGERKRTRNYQNSALQIAQCIIQAGLLIEDANYVNPQNISQILNNDFAKLYNSRHLIGFLQTLINSKDQQNSQETINNLFKALEPLEKPILFMDRSIVQKINQHLD